jgi:hypothetical protein
LFVYRKNKTRTGRKEPGCRLADGPMPSKLVLETTKCTDIGIGCGKTPAYPQDGMCRTPFFWLTGLFVHERFSLDTMFFQRVNRTVNH